MSQDLTGSEFLLTPECSEVSTAQFDPSQTAIAPSPTEDIDSMQGTAVRLRSIELQVCHSPGRSPAIVFIHGGLGSRFNWRIQWEYLRSHGHELLAYDLAGHGSSGRYRRYSVGRHRRDLTRLLHRFKIQNPILCCHSYGVPIGLEWARRHPVTGLIAIGGGTHNLTPWWEIPVMKFFAAGGHHIYRWHRVHDGMRSLLSPDASEAVHRFFTESPLPSDPHPYQAIESFWGYDGRLHVPAYPVCVIAGEKDFMFTPAMAAELAQHCSRAGHQSRHIIVPGAGHLVMVEAPDVVNRAIMDMIPTADIDEGNPQTAY